MGEGGVKNPEKLPSSFIDGPLRLLNTRLLLLFPIFPKTRAFIFRYINRDTDPNAL